MIKIMDFFSKKSEEEDGGKVLRIDCRECECKFGLDSKNCMKCLCDCAGMDDYEEISFISGSETRYRADASRVFISFAHIVNAISQNADGKCDGCPLSGKSIRNDVLADVTEENVSFLGKRMDMIYVQCERCGECASRGKVSVGKFSTDLKELMNDGLIVAFKMVGA